MRDIRPHLRSAVAAATSIALLALALVAAPASAVEGLDFTTPYPAVRIDPGGEVTFPLMVQTAAPERVALQVAEAPEGWETKLRGGGNIVDAVYTIGQPAASGAEQPELELEVAVPEDASPGDYQVRLVATGSPGSTDLVLDLAVTEVVAGSVSLTTDFPSLRGDTGESFSFSLQLHNDTAQEVTFGLEAVGPPGWDVTAELATETQAATAVVAAGDDERINVTVRSPEDAVAGAYPVHVTASGGAYTAEADLEVELTGSYSLSLDTPDGRLSTTVTGGGSSPFQIVVINDGSADLTEVSLDATPPQGWEVTFEPATIDVLAAGEQTTVTATIQTTGSTVAGDYQITMSADAAEASDDVQIRTTVETSSLWGVVGLGLIGVVILGLYLVFRRYGRR